MFGSKRKDTSPESSPFDKKRIDAVDFSVLFAPLKKSERTDAPSFLRDEASGAVRGPSLMEEGYAALREGAFDRAEESFRRAVFLDLNNDLPNEALKCASYWAERKRKYTFLERARRVEFLFESIRSFKVGSFIKSPSAAERAVYCALNWAYDAALTHLRETERVEPSSELYLRMGRAYKGKGDFDDAVDAYKSGLVYDKNDARLLAEIGDCHAIMDNEASAALFFREAFFRDPAQIEWEYLSSAMIRALVSKTEKEEIDPAYLSSWVGVYGIVFGVFSVFRELRPVEYARLNQSIHALKTEMDEEPERERELAPLLIYKLLWLIDYYRGLSSEREPAEIHISRALLDIKFLNEAIWKRYRL